MNALSKSCTISCAQTIAKSLLGSNVNPPPEEVVTTIIFPEDGATDVLWNDSFIWEFSSNIIEYQILYGTTESLETELVAWSPATNGSLAIPRMSSNTVYYWQINVKTNTETIKGVINSYLSANPVNVPNSPYGHFPDPGTTGLLNDDTFGGALRYGTTGYKVLLDTVNPPVTEYVPLTPHTGSLTKTITITDLLDSTTYYWMLVPCNSAGCNTNSYISNFITGITGAHLPEPVYDMTPHNNAILVEDTDTITFNTGIGTTEYQVLFGMETTPINVLKDWTVVGEDESVMVVWTNIIADTDFYWQVNTRNQYGTTYGVIMKFTFGSFQPMQTPTVTNAIASDITDTGFTVDADIDPHNGSTILTFEWGRNDIYDNSIPIAESPITTITHITKVVSGLPSDKNIIWRIKAVKSGIMGYDGDTTKTLYWRTTNSTGDPDYYSAGNTFYIDPTVETSGDGSIGSPWKSWRDIVWGNNRVYLIKRGTTLIDNNFGYFDTLTNVTIAGYGTGNRPVLLGTTTNTSAKILDFGGIGNTNLIISGLEVKQQGDNISTLLNFANDNHSLIIENSYLHNGLYAIRLRANNNIPFENTIIRNCVVEDIYDDGIYAFRQNGLTIQNCHIQKVNNSWVAPYTPQEEASGDCMQFVLVNDYHIIDTVLDRSSSGNKFAFIQNAPGNGIIEHCELISPISTADGGAVQYSQAGNMLTTKDCIIRGNSSDPSTSLAGIYNNNSSGRYTSERNHYINLPTGIISVLGTVTSKDDVFTNCNNDTQGSVTFL